MTSPLTRPRRSGVLLKLVLPAAAVMAVACGGSSKSGTTQSAATATTAAPAAATTTAGSTTSAAPPGQDNLTGTYSGHQAGAYSGTLTIIWQESGWKRTSSGAYHANLDGTIKLSNPAGTQSVQGTWRQTCLNGHGPGCNKNAGAIQFRTVTGTPILYTGVWGSSNGSALSGSYRAAKGDGSFSALQVGAP